MKKYRSLVNIHTLAILGVSLLSAFVCLRFSLKLYLDFLILSILIGFPITLTIRESFRRRERALQYLCTFKAYLQSMVYCVDTGDLEEKEKGQFRKIATVASNCLCEDLRQTAFDPARIKQSSGAIVSFINLRKKQLKSSTVSRLFNLFSKVDESVEFLLSTKRHHTPESIHLLVLAVIYLFTIFYPASVLYRSKDDVALWHLFSLTAFKSILLITLYNMQSSLEDPFNPNSPDAVRLDDFNFRNNL